MTKLQLGLSSFKMASKFFLISLGFLENLRCFLLPAATRKEQRCVHWCNRASLMDGFSGHSHGKREFAPRISGCAEIRLEQGRHEKIGKGFEPKHTLTFFLTHTQFQASTMIYTSQGSKYCSWILRFPPKCQWSGYWWDEELYWSLLFKADLEQRIFEAL